MALRPPYSGGQPGTSQPASKRDRCQRRAHSGMWAEDTTRSWRSARPRGGVAPSTPATRPGRPRSPCRSAIAPRDRSLDTDTGVSVGAGLGGECRWAPVAPTTTSGGMGTRPANTYELFTCSWKGHVLVGTDAAHDLGGRRRRRPRDRRGALLPLPALLRLGGDGGALAGCPTRDGAARVRRSSCLCGAGCCATGTCCGSSPSTGPSTSSS